MPLPPTTETRRDRVRRIRVRVAAGAATGFVALWGVVWAFGPSGGATAKAASWSTGTQDPAAQASGFQDPAQGAYPAQGSSSPGPVVTGQS
jgi:hypothetical protein